MTVEEFKALPKNESRALMLKVGGQLLANVVISIAVGAAVQLGVNFVVDKIENRHTKELTN